MIRFDVFALSPQGYEVHFQLQGEKVYEDAVKLLAILEKDGFLVRGKGGTKEAGRGGQAEHYCQKHQTEYHRNEKDGQAWYSHKVDGGGWCREPQPRKKGKEVSNGQHHHQEEVLL